MPPTLGLSMVRMNSLDVVLLKTSLKPGSHSAAEVTCRVLCYDGSTLLVTSKGDAMAQWADAVEGNAYHLQIPGKCLKPNRRASETGVVGPWEIYFDETFLMTSTVLASPYHVRFDFKPFTYFADAATPVYGDVVGRVVAFESQLAGEAHLLRRFTLINNFRTMELRLHENTVATELQVGDVVAIKGVMVMRTENVSHFAVAPLTFIAVNPNEPGTLDLLGMMVTPGGMHVLTENVRELRDSLKTIGGLVPVISLRVSSDGLQVLEMDQSGVLFVDFVIRAPFFLAIFVQGMVCLSVSVHALCTALDLCSKTSSNVELYYMPSASVLTVTSHDLYTGTCVYTIPLHRRDVDTWHVDALRVIDNFEVDIITFRRVVEQLLDVDTTVRLCRRTPQTLSLEAEATVINARVTLRSRALSVTPYHGSSARVTTRYLFNCVNAASWATTVHIQMTREGPITLQLQFAKPSFGRLHCTLAQALDSQ